MIAGVVLAYRLYRIGAVARFVSAITVCIHNMKGTTLKIDRLSFFLLVPVIALICTPLLPFVNASVSFFGIPVILFWVGAWALVTSAFLNFLFGRESELDDLDMDRAGLEAGAER